MFDVNCNESHTAHQANSKTDSGQLGAAECPASVIISQTQMISDAGPLGNTPASNRHEAILDLQGPLSPMTNEEPPLIAKSDLNRPTKTAGTLPGGLDMLEVRIMGNWEPRQWEKIRPQLESAKKVAETEGPQLLQTIEGESYTVTQHTIGRGDGSYRWKIHYEGCVILVKDQPSYNERYPNVIVELGSIMLMDYGHIEAWSMVIRVLNSLGFRVGDTHVSRADLCVDLPNVHVQEFVTPFKHDWCLRRARKWRIYGEGLIKDSTGFEVGTDIHIRIYDKLTEVKNDSYKFGVMIARRWGGKIPESATRVEFQIRRTPLKDQFQVDSVEDLFKRMPDMVVWLTSEWFRLTDGEPDRENGNESRSKTSDLWEHVSQLFSYWAGKMQMIVAPRKRGKPSVERLSRQALGCLTSAVAVLGKVPSDIGELFCLVQEPLERALYKGKNLLETLVMGKREKLRARVGSTCIAIEPTDIPF